jgi:hypothetical protein
MELACCAHGLQAIIEVIDWYAGYENDSSSVQGNIMAITTVCEYLIGPICNFLGEGVPEKRSTL